MQPLHGGYIQMLRHYFIESLCSHLMWGRESGERHCAYVCVGVSAISSVIFFSSANLIVHSSLQKCVFVDVETYSDEMLSHSIRKAKSSLIHLLGG